MMAKNPYKYKVGDVIVVAEETMFRGVNISNKIGIIIERTRVPKSNKLIFDSNNKVHNLYSILICGDPSTIHYLIESRINKKID